MHAFTEKDLRASFVNASLRERNSLTIPDLTSVEWDKLDYFGWREPKQPLAGFLVVAVDEAPVGILLRQTEQRTRTRAQARGARTSHCPTRS